MRVFSLCTFVRFETTISPSIRFDIILQNFKKPLDSFSPQLGKKVLETCVQRCLWDEGKGRVWEHWRTPQKFKSISRLLSTIVVCLHPSYQVQFLCQESVNRSQDSNKCSPGTPTLKRPQVGMNYGKRRARRREGAGDKAPECAIAGGS